MAQFIAIANKTYINRDQVISVKYVGGGMWFVNTTDRKCHECRDERAIKVLYGNVEKADAPLNATAIAEGREPDAFEVFEEGYNPDKRIKPTQSNVDWVKRAQDALRATFRCAACTTDVFRIYKDAYATVHPTSYGYKVIVRSDFIAGQGDVLATVIFNPANPFCTPEMNGNTYHVTNGITASIKSSLTTGVKEAIDDMVAVLPE